MSRKTRTTSRAAATAATSPAVTTTPAGGSRWARWSWLGVLGLLALVAAVAYRASFVVPFLFDDGRQVVTNVLRLAPLPVAEQAWQILHDSRPVVLATLAVNHALGGLAVWGYHLFNVVAHVLAGFLLFLLVRRTLRSPRLGAHWAAAAQPLALAVALLWVAHPLQTESVTYVIQRAEVLLGLFLWLTLYAVARTHGERPARGWFLVVLAAIAAGVACKPTMVVAPLLALLYDAAFGPGGWRGALRRGWWFYGALAVGAVVVGALFVRQAIVGDARFQVGWGARFDYLWTQAGVLTHYLTLVLWPDPLCFDYGWQIAHGPGEIVPYAVLIGGMLVASLWALWRRPGLGFVGLAFFIVLAPTSSFMVIPDVAAERRMYEPLAAVLVLLVLGAYLLGRRAWAAVYGVGVPLTRGFWQAGAVLLTLVLLALVAVTHARNLDYADEITLWKSVLRTRPTNTRALNNLGCRLFEQGRLDEAAVYLRRSISLPPTYREDQTDLVVHHNLGAILMHLDQYAEAAAEFRVVMKLNPNVPKGHFELALALARCGHVEEAIAEFRLQLQRTPGMPECWNELGAALGRSGRLDEATAAFTSCLQVDPHFGPALANLGGIELERGQYADARAHFTAAIRQEPANAANHIGLARAALYLADFATTISAATAAERLHGPPMKVETLLGIGYLRAGQAQLALPHLLAAVKLDPSPNLYRALGDCQLQLGQGDAAAASHARAQAGMR